MLARARVKLVVLLQLSVTITMMMERKIVRVAPMETIAAALNTPASRLPR